MEPLALAASIELSPLSEAHSTEALLVQPANEELAAETFLAM
jgi:hypothetical protein